MRPARRHPREARGRALRAAGYRGPLDEHGNKDTRTEAEWLADARRASTRTRTR